MLAPNRQAESRDWLADVIHNLRAQIEFTLDMGFARERVIVDAGLGAQNVEWLDRLGELRVLGCPIQLDVSCVGGNADEMAVPIALGIVCGADIVCTRDVKQVVRAAKMSDAVVRNR